MKKFSMLSATIIAIAIFSLATPQAASAASRVRTIDYNFMFTACSQQHGTPSYVVSVANNVMGWRCQYHGGWNAINQGIDLSKECRRLYGSRAYADYTNFNNKNSWSCYR